MKKGLKKILAATTALALLFSMGTSAMAAVYTTTTEYTDDAVRVTTQVTGLEQNTEVAYLVYADKDEGNDVDDNEIVYIDQKNSGVEDEFNSTMTFGFATDLEKLLKSGKTYSAEVKVGANAGTVTAGSPKNVVLNGRTITYSGEGCYVLVDEGAIIDTEDTQPSTEDAFDNQKIVFYIFAMPGHTLLGATVNGEEMIPSNGGYTVYEYSVDGDADLTFACPALTYGEDEAPGVEPTIVAPGEGSSTKYTEVGDVRKLVVFGNATNAVEFGILFSNEKGKIPVSLSKEELGNYGVNTKNVRKYTALGMSSNGSFAIELIDSKAANDDKYVGLTNEIAAYAAVYAVDGNGNVTITDVQTITK